MQFRRGNLTRWGVGLLAAGGLGFVVLTSPWTWSLLHPAKALPPLEGANLENGRQVFVASDCATCHATPGQGKDTVLGGGRVLDTAFGLFHMPNVSPDKEHGIGDWTLAEFDRAVREGVGPKGPWPDGENFYPAFPYTSYQRLSGEDVRDLYAYMMSLPAVSQAVPEHELKFPFNMRRGVGLWRLAFLDGKPFEPAPVPAGVDAEQFHRGQYLVEGAGHCAECHSPRGVMGNVIAEQRYGGGATPEATGWFPNISPDETGIGFWSAASIANYLKTGVSPIGRVAAGDMAEVIHNTSQLPFADLQAMAAWLKHVPAVDRPAPGMPEPNRTADLVMLKTAVASGARMPVSAENDIGAGMQATVVETKNFWLDAAAVGGQVEPQGKLLGGGLVQVARRDPKAGSLVLKGWQQLDAPSVIYQARGQRVMTAVLSDEAIKALKRGPEEKDEETGLVWAPVEITVWSDVKGLNTDRAKVWAYSKGAYEAACSTCHVLPQKGHFTANQWIGTLKSMRRFTSFSDDQYRLILSYLQNHSKDLNEDREAGKHAAAH